MTKQVPNGHVKNTLVWLAYMLLSVWLAVASAWWVSSHINYGFPLWYQVLDIEQHIDQYAPQHPHKRGFEQLPPEQHWRAFAQITAAVHDRGQRLEDIYYRAPGDVPMALLDPLEVTHLQDVRDLLRRFSLITLWLIPLWLLLALVSMHLPPPGWHQRLPVLVGLPVVLGAILVIAGPTAVFYALHEWLFPPENPWFFYWEESLMSTLMRA
ncbi:MAG: DUF1461 domain-containing protein, partial [Gammaproteobacteria bacterium HGW-Gammaproteobacteria-14]